MPNAKGKMGSSRFQTEPVSSESSSAAAGASTPPHQDKKPPLETNPEDVPGVPSVHTPSPLLVQTGLEVEATAAAPVAALPATFKKFDIFDSIDAER
eukprot:CAMPEP_0176244276 /NCGR_PEP_ID=MMETSP0121_2-20121125/31349_1 /TAXON_ID=160619 /ORGANISM="Kryptoperidinium foliaceum, Strain CCMP 1326" /LENGTH=96 /DNA_ID=CAMNT_0017583881 /DNA_START=8 /DNA_END=294 /DNA_ORIENTATION=+